MKKKNSEAEINLPKLHIGEIKNHDHSHENETCCGDCKGKESCSRIPGDTLEKDSDK